MKRRIKETSIELMNSQIWGIEVTEEQLKEQAKIPKLRKKNVFFGPIAERWHEQHPIKEVDDDRNLLGS